MGAEGWRLAIKSGLLPPGKERTAVKVSLCASHSAQQLCRRYCDTHSAEEDIKVWRGSDPQPEDRAQLWPRSERLPHSMLSPPLAEKTGVPQRKEDKDKQRTSLIQNANWA